MVLAIRDTGITINDDPVVDFDLEVTPADGAPFSAQTQRWGFRARASGFPGAGVGDVGRPYVADGRI